MSTAEVIFLCIAIFAILAVVWLLYERKNMTRVREKFGPEYERLAGTEGARKATTILAEREKRLSRLTIRPLSNAERSRFSEEWREVQERFVDDPSGSILRADALVNEAMRTRGYPVTDFDQAAADLSVDHAGVVENYRIAHDIIESTERRRASTEDIRKAMQHYRKVMESILDTRVVERVEVR